MTKEKLEKSKIIREIKFAGIDDWNLPIFKVTNADKPYYVSDVHNLFSWGTSEEEIKEFYKDKDLTQCLTYHGSKFDSEAHGGRLKDEIQLVLI